MNDLLSPRRAIITMLLGAFMISFSAVFVKVAEVAPTCSAFYRVAFGCCFLGLITWFRGEWRPPPRRTLALLLFCGLAFALDLFFWHESIMYIGPGLATLISNFQVFFLAAVAIFFLGERARPRFLLSLPIAVFGLFLVVGPNWHQLSDDYKIGISFALLTALCYAVYLITLRRAQSASNSSPLFSLMLVSCCSTVFLGLKMVNSGDSFVIPDLKSLSALLALGLCSQTLGWLLIARALPRLPTSLGGLILLLQPALSFVWDVLLFARPTSLINWTGVTLTLAAIYMGATGKSSRP
jgi:drug/metabolite transporter (DMT)-like permease